MSALVSVDFGGGVAFPFALSLPLPFPSFAFPFSFPFAFTLTLAFAAAARSAAKLGPCATYTFRCAESGRSGRLWCTSGGPGR